MSLKNFSRVLFLFLFTLLQNDLLSSEQNNLTEDASFKLFLFTLLQNDLLSSEQNNLTKDASFKTAINSAKANNQDYTTLLERIINGYEGTKDSDYPMFSKNFATQSYLDLAELTLKKAMTKGLVTYNKFALLDEAKLYAQKASSAYSRMAALIQKIEECINSDKNMYYEFLEGEKAYNTKNYQEAVNHFNKFISAEKETINSVPNANTLEHKLTTQERTVCSNTLENIYFLIIKSHQYLGLIYSEDIDGIKNLSLAKNHLRKALNDATFYKKKTENNSYKFKFYNRLYEEIKRDLETITHQESTICSIQ